MSDNKNEVLISRQLILNRNQEIMGYELSLVSTQTPDDIFSKPILDSERLICSVYLEFGIKNALGNHKAFLPIDPFFLHDTLLETIDASSVVLEMIVADIPNKKVIERCIELKDKKYVLAYLDYNGLDDKIMPLLAMTGLVKIDIRNQTEENLVKIIGPIVNLPIELMAYGIENDSDIDLCKRVGFHYFQGNYFSRPEIVRGRHLTTSQLGLIKLINLATQDIDNNLLEEAIKREPAIAINLICLVNTADRIMSRKISSIKDAVIVLGRRKLQRWLQLLLMVPGEQSPDITKSPILQLSVLKGQMMEILVKRIYPNNHKLLDNAFMTGVMSLMHIALGMTLDDIFDHIDLDSEIENAIRHKTGSLGVLLDIIDAYDNADVAKCDELMKLVPEPGIDRAVLNTALVLGLSWINDTDN